MMDFQKLLADRGICVHYDVEDLLAILQLGWIQTQLLPKPRPLDLLLCL